MRTATHNALQEIERERERQVAEEGWAPEHDDAHGKGELADAAACYAAGQALALCTGNIDRYHRPISRDLWPWARERWKPGLNRRRQLVKAGALIVAELERLERASRK